MPKRPQPKPLVTLVEGYRPESDGPKHSSGPSGEWQWSAQKEEVAVWVAVDEMTNREIAEKAGIHEDTLYEWKKRDEFKARVEENREEIRKRVLTTGIADPVNRIRRYNKRWNQIDAVFQARARDNSHMSVPGYDTGILAHEQKSLGSGDLATVVDLYKFETAAIKEERELAKQASQELGQWEERVKHTFDLTKLTDEELEALESIQSKLAANS